MTLRNTPESIGPARKTRRRQACESEVRKAIAPEALAVLSRTDNFPNRGGATKKEQQ